MSQITPIPLTFFLIALTALHTILFSFNASLPKTSFFSLGTSGKIATALIPAS